MGRLDIRICTAKNLPDVQTFGDIDPYCIVKLEHQVHKTSVCSNKQSPTWNEVFKFTVADPDSAQIRFELWNKNLVSDDFLGVYTLSIGGLHRGKVKEGWYLLQQCKSNAELHIRLKAIDFGEIHPDGEDAQDFMGHSGFIQPGAGAAPAAAPGYPPQQAPPAQGYPPQQPPAGYPPQQPPAGYPPQQPPAQPGYPPQQPGYPPAQPGYPPQQPGYPPQQPGYPPQQPGYPPQQPGYPPAQPGYPPQQPGYPPAQPGYPPQAAPVAISYARYHDLDVTGRVQQMSASFGGRSVNLDGNYNNHFGDPAPGVPKRFIIGLTDGRTFEFAEGQPCNAAW